jgi:hypothetical protein
MTMSSSSRRSSPLEPALCEWGAPANMAGPWACVLIGIRHAATPGEILLSDDGVERAWIDGKPVPLGTYRREAERAVRELAKQYPHGALARDLARLDEARRRVRTTRTLLRSFLGPRPVRLGLLSRRRTRRPMRRVRVARKLRHRGADPPDPPGAEEPPSSDTALTVVFAIGEGARGRTRWQWVLPRSGRRRWPT